MFQKLTIVGNLGRDPEMRYLPDGTAVTNLNIATNRRYTKSDGTAVSETTWFRVSVWGKPAEACNEYLQKGSKVLVEGTLTADKATGGPRVWTRSDGTAGALFEVRADGVQFLNSRQEAADAADPAGEEEMPF